MTAEPNLIESFADLVHLLEREGVFHRSNLAEMTVEIPTQRGSLDSVMLVRWQPSDGVIQFIQALPLSVADDQIGCLVDAVTRLNHVLAIPGFDVNHPRKILAYRLYLPLQPRGGVTAVEIQRMFQLTVKTASELMPVLARVLSGQTRPEEVVADAQREYAALAAAQTPPPPTTAMN
jgi:hypothetical protein